MTSLSWISQLCQGWRKSQIKTFAALYEAFVEQPSVNLNEIAFALYEQTGVAVRHTVKRIWRFLGNPRLNHDVFYQNIINFVWPYVQSWAVIPIALDWTFNEKHEKWQCLVASLIVGKRGIPLLVRAFRDHDYEDEETRSRVEESFVEDLKKMLPPLAPNQIVVILADRGFGCTSLFQKLQELQLHFCIRLSTGAYFWKNGYGRQLDNSMIDPGDPPLLWKNVLYPDSCQVHLARLAATCAKPKKGKEKDPWFLASSLVWDAEPLIALYAKRMIIEEDFRSAKMHLHWEDSRIRKLEHYRTFVLPMVATLVSTMLVGTTAVVEDSPLVHKVARKRKGKWDSSVTYIGLRILKNNIAHLSFLGRIPQLTPA